jgi:GAF domain-containing protein
MTTTPSPSSEAHRLAVLRSYGILDTDSDQVLDDLTLLAAQICGTPIALVSLLDEHRQWFASKVGLSTIETPRDIAFCERVLQRDGMLIVPDATQDKRFAENPSVTGEPGIRFYAGAPLRSPEGSILGTLCVIDRVPRGLTPAQEKSLEALARQVMFQFEFRRRACELAEAEGLLRAIFDTEPDSVMLLGHDCVVHMMNRAGLAMLEAENLEALSGKCFSEFVVPQHRQRLQE